MDYFTVIQYNVTKDQNKLFYDYYIQAVRLGLEKGKKKKKKS